MPTEVGKLGWVHADNGLDLCPTSYASPSQSDDARQDRSTRLFTLDDVPPAERGRVADAVAESRARRRPAKTVPRGGEADLRAERDEMRRLGREAEMERDTLAHANALLREQLAEARALAQAFVNDPHHAPMAGAWLDHDWLHEPTWARQDRDGDGDDQGATVAGQGRGQAQVTRWSNMMLDSEDHWMVPPNVQGQYQCRACRVPWPCPFAVENAVPDDGGDDD